MGTGNTYSAETKAAVVGAILAGMAMGAAARQAGVPKSTVRGWLRQAGHPITPSVNQEKRVDLGALIADYLRDGLTALAAEARLFADPAWIRTQSAGELAILHGVLADKLTRLVTALEPVDGGDSILDAAAAPDPADRS